METQIVGWPGPDIHISKVKIENLFLPKLTHPVISLCTGVVAVAYESHTTMKKVTLQQEATDVPGKQYGKRETRIQRPMVYPLPLLSRENYSKISPTRRFLRILKSHLLSMFI